MENSLEREESLSPAAKAWENLTHEQRGEIRDGVFEHDMVLEWSEAMSRLVLVKLY